MIVEKVLEAKGSEVLTIGPDDTVGAIAKLFEKKRRGLAVVCGTDGEVMGVVSLGDIVHAVGHDEAGALSLPARKVMTSDVASCAPGDDIETALDKMKTLDIRHLPIVEDGRLRGVVEQRDALEVLFEEAALDFAQLRSYVFKTGGQF